MREYLDIAANTGYWTDPRILYDLTPAEIAAVIAGQVAQERRVQQAENIRAGTICAMMVAPYRSKGSPPLTWKDFFPDTTAKPAQSEGHMKRIAKGIALAFGGKVVQRES